MKKFVCPVCGYVHEGEKAPDFCPVCKVPGEKFRIMEEGAALAAEHEYGVYAKTVKTHLLIFRYGSLSRFSCAQILPLAASILQSGFGFNDISLMRYDIRLAPFDILASHA